MQIDGELASFLQPGPYSVLVVNCDSNLVPESVRAWGLHLLDDGETIDVLVGREPSQRLVENWHHNDLMAVAVANVTTYQGLQLKGRCIGVGEPTADDYARLRAHCDAFVVGATRVGIPESAARGMRVNDVIRLRFRPSQLFDQTPGPNAGVER